MKFFCDEMLGRLGRWLRAAGYDAEIAEASQSDKQIYERAQKEQRILLTRDKHFLEIKTTSGLLVVNPTDSLEEWVGLLNGLYPMNWLLNPFSRCLVCNEILIRPHSDLLTQVPEDVLQHSQHFRYCERCNKVYWEGSHTKRMFIQLEQWQRRKEN